MPLGCIAAGNCTQKVSLFQPPQTSLPNAVEKQGLRDESKENVPQQEGKENVPQQPQVMIKTSAAWSHAREVEQLKQKLAHEEELRMKAEAQAGLGRNARKSCLDTQGQLELQAKEIDSLMMRCTDAEEQHRLADKRAKDLEVTANFEKRQRQGKEQAMAALQQDMELVQDEVKSLRCQLEEFDGMQPALEKLRQENCTLRARLQAFEEDDEEKLEIGVQTEVPEDRNEDPVVQVSASVIRREVDAEIRRRFGALLKELSNLRARTLSNEKRVEALQSPAADVDSEADFFNARIAAAKAIHQGELSCLCEEVSRLRSALQFEQQEFALLLHQQHLQATKAPDSEEELARLSSELAVQEVEVHMLQQRLAEQAEELASMHEEAAKMQVETPHRIPRERLEQRVAEQAQEILRAREIAATLCTENEKQTAQQRLCLDSELERVREEASSLRAENQMQKAEIQHLVELDEEAASLRAEEASALQAEANKHRALEQKLAEQAEELLRARKEAATLRAENGKQTEQLIKDAVTAVNTAKGTHPAADGDAFKDAQDLRVRNRELLLTVEQFKQECEMLEVDNRSLQESVAAFEENMDKVAGDNAKLSGHVNHKQKIKYTMKLKDEVTSLKESLKSQHKKFLTLEASKRGSILEALPSLCALSQAKRSVVAFGSGYSTPTAEMRKLSEEHESTVEAVVQDFLHLRALIERAVSDVSPADNQSSDIGTLLQLLRGVVTDGRRSRRGSAAATASNTTEKWDQLE